MIEAEIADENVIVNNILNYVIYGSVFAAIILLAILRIFCFKVKMIKNFLMKIWRAIFWNLFIRVVIETCMENSVINLIRMYTINT